jgi:hypothetical protein
LSVFNSQCSVTGILDRRPFRATGLQTPLPS